MRQFTLPMVTMDYPYGMPTTMMAGFQTNASTYATTAFSPNNTHLTLGSALSILGWNGQPSLTTASLMSLRQQIDESNYDIVNMLTQQIDTTNRHIIL